MSSIETIRAIQNPGTTPSKNSVQFVMNTAAIGINNMRPLAFITTNPSILLDANVLTSNAINGACKLDNNAIIKYNHTLPLIKFVANNNASVATNPNR